MAEVAAGEPEVAFRAARLVARAEAMGLIPAGDEPQGFSPDLLSDAINAFNEASIGLRAVALIGVRFDTAAAVLRALQVLDDEVESSAVPRTEWISMADRLGLPLLSKVLDISESSIRRYLNRERPTPDDVANRLHFVALLVADLAGGYNEYGIRRWFARPRAQLDGGTPLSVLAGKWSPDNERVAQVRELASAIGSSPGT
jgi:hypothetical protein